MFGYLGHFKDMRSRVRNVRYYVEANIVQAREYIYRWGNTVDGTKVGETLGKGSWVPVVVSVSCLLLCPTSSYE